MKKWSVTATKWGVLGEHMELTADVFASNLQFALRRFEEVTRVGIDECVSLSVREVENESK